MNDRVSQQPQRSMLVVIAHPDDEATFAGTLAKYASEGVRITVVCTTNGGGGTGSNELGADVLATRRRGELIDACGELGITDVRFFEGADQPPHLGRHNYDLVVDDHRASVLQLINELAPQVVITFGPEGVTGHQTHLKVGQLTEEAVAAAENPPALYQVAYSADQVESIHRWLIEHSRVLSAYAEEVRRQPNLGSETPVLLSVPDDLIAAQIDVSAFAATKRAALSRHASQGGGEGGILSAFNLITVEHFRLAKVQATTSSIVDLFAPAHLDRDVEGVSAS